MNLSIKIKGVRKTMQTLDNLNKNLINANESTAIETANGIVKIAKQLAPRYTGNLRSSINWRRISKNRISVGPPLNHPYARNIMTPSPGPYESKITESLGAWLRKVHSWSPQRIGAWRRYNKKILVQNVTLKKKPSGAGRVYRKGGKYYMPFMQESVQRISSNIPAIQVRNVQAAIARSKVK
ncbi:MAG: hypothetical protein ACTSXD_08540 [Candidatus Heimdallarchaeaceae archaeon]